MYNAAKKSKKKKDWEHYNTHKTKLEKLSDQQDGTT